jgi:hypothetical protein
MILDKVRSWWRSLPQKTRVKLIASVLLVFAGTEVFVLAPYIIDIALMIDVGGLVLVLAALRSSVSVSMMDLRSLMTVITKPFFAVLRACEMVEEFGSVLLAPRWFRHYFLFDRIVTRGAAGLLMVVCGLVLTKTLIAIL